MAKGSRKVEVDTSTRPGGDFSDFLVEGNSPTAEQQAKNALRNANKNENTGQVTLFGDPRLVTGVTVTLKNAGAFDGKMIVESATHKLPGYRVDLELRKCLDGY